MLGSQSPGTTSGSVVREEKVLMVVLTLEAALWQVRLAQKARARARARAKQTLALLPLSQPWLQAG